MGVMMGAKSVVVALVFGLVVVGLGPEVAMGQGATGTPGAGAGFPASRDPYAWPFAPESIWNLPIAAEAQYIPAGILPATQRALTVDEDIIILTPDAPLTDVFLNEKGWSDRTEGARCAIEGPVIAAVPIPPDFVYGQNADETPNASAAILLPDGETLFQTQPFHRCEAGANATSQYIFADMNIRTGNGIEGSHGGSRMSSIGGTLRLGELAPGSTIRHALKVNIFGQKNMVCEAAEPDGASGLRWPALTTDGYACDDASPLRYGGANPALQLGALLALPPEFDPESFETEPARILARTFQDYGAYVVDDTAWDVYAIMTERGPAGRVVDEFAATWGFEMTAEIADTPWARDIARIFESVQIVDNNAPETPGGGPLGGERRAPLAPPFQADGAAGTPVPGATPVTATVQSGRMARRSPGAARTRVGARGVTAGRRSRRSGRR